MLIDVISTSSHIALILSSISFDVTWVD